MRLGFRNAKIGEVFIHLLAEIGGRLREKKKKGKKEEKRRKEEEKKREKGRREIYTKKDA